MAAEAESSIIPSSRAIAVWRQFPTGSDPQVTERIRIVGHNRVERLFHLLVGRRFEHAEFLANAEKNDFLLERGSFPQILGNQHAALLVRLAGLDPADVNRLKKHSRLRELAHPLGQAFDQLLPGARRVGFETWHAGNLEMGHHQAVLLDRTEGFPESSRDRNASLAI